MSVAGTIIFRQMSGMAKEGGLRNKTYKRGNIDVASIENKMRENRPRRFVPTFNERGKEAVIAVNLE